MHMVVEPNLMVVMPICKGWGPPQRARGPTSQPPKRPKLNSRCVP